MTEPVADERPRSRRSTWRGFDFFPFFPFFFNIYLHFHSLFLFSSFIFFSSVCVCVCVCVRLPFPKPIKHVQKSCSTKTKNQISNQKKNNNKTVVKLAQPNKRKNLRRVDRDAIKIDRNLKKKPRNDRLLFVFFVCFLFVFSLFGRDG